MSKAVEILIVALLQEFALDTVDDLLVMLARKGIKVSMQVATDLFYEWQWNHRKQIEYKRVTNSLNVNLDPRKMPKR